MKTFLTDEELVELTGARRKSNQIRWLTQHRYPHETNANGAPKVLRCYLERRLADIEPDHWRAGADAWFIAAANPATVLALLARGQEVVIEYATISA